LRNNTGLSTEVTVAWG